MSKVIRIQTRNNSDARRFTVLDSVRGAACRHNGGKTVVVTIDDSDIDAAVALLDASHAVASYEVQS